MVCKRSLADPDKISNNTLCNIFCRHHRQARGSFLPGQAAAADGSEQEMCCLLASSDSSLLPLNAILMNETRSLTLLWQSLLARFQWVEVKTRLSWGCGYSYIMVKPKMFSRIVFHTIILCLSSVTILGKLELGQGPIYLEQVFHSGVTLLSLSTVTLWSGVVWFGIIRLVLYSRILLGDFCFSMVCHGISAWYRCGMWYGVV